MKDISDKNIMDALSVRNKKIESLESQLKEAREWMKGCRKEFKGMIEAFEKYGDKKFDNTVKELQKSIAELDNLLNPK